MEPRFEPADDARLTNISTRLSKLFQAGPAGHEEFLRYYGAAFRYFRALVRDADVAQELTHNFAQRHFEGRFQAYDPGKGRFRDFLKVALRNMAMDYLRGRKRGAVADLPHEELLDDDKSQHFENAWREEILHQAWQTLERLEKETGKPQHTVLRFKSEHPNLASDELARELGKIIGKSLTPEAARQLVHRAREAFQEILLDEVTRSLGSFELEEIEAELADLKLLTYCEESLKKRKRLKKG